jgi:hypothetical protein
MAEELTHNEASHVLILRADDPKPALEQKSSFPNPVPKIDNETAPEVAALNGED